MPTRPHDEVMAAVIWACAFLNAIDLLLIYFGFGAGYELNPLMKWAMHHGWEWACMVKLTLPNVVLLFWWEMREKLAARVMAWTTLVAYMLFIALQLIVVLQ